MKYKRKGHAHKLWAVLAAMPLLAGPADPSWEALRHLPKHHIYTVLNRSGSCVTGAFVSADEKEIVLAAQQGEQSIAKPNILRIASGQTADIHTTVYTARSSWADLLALETPPYYSDLMVVTSDNRQFKGPLLGVSRDQLTLFIDNHEMRFAKEYVDRVFLTSTEPTFERGGAHRSLIKLRKKSSSQTQAVPLYEVTQPQDDSPVDCSPGQRRQ